MWLIIYFYRLVLSPYCTPSTYLCVHKCPYVPGCKDASVLHLLRSAEPLVAGIFQAFLQRSEISKLVSLLHIAQFCIHQKVQPATRALFQLLWRDSVLACFPLFCKKASLFLAPAEGFGRGFCFALWAKKEIFTLFVLIIGHFQCSVVTFVIFSSNLQ